MNNFSINNNFKNFSILKPLKQQEQKSVVYFKGLQKDVFVKNANTNSPIKASQVEKNFDETHIKRLYDEAYNEAMALMPPIAKELNIKKPTLSFYDDERELSKIASYDFYFNKIEISKYLIQKDFYLQYAKDGDKKIPLEIVNEEFLKNINPQQNIEFVKLNDDEKEVYIKSCIAHELRHCVQDHLINSCNKSKDEIQKKYQILTEAISIYKKSIDEAIKLYETALQKGILTFEGIRVTEKLQRLKQEKQQYENPYLEQFKPAKIFDENTLLETTMQSDDGKHLYLSIKDHFLKGHEEQFDKRQNNEEKFDSYLVYPHEIDAYAFQAAYIAKTAPIKENGKINDMCLCIIANYQYGKDNLEKYGYKPLIKEN